MYPPPPPPARDSCERAPATHTQCMYGTPSVRSAAHSSRELPHAQPHAGGPSLLATAPPLSRVRPIPRHHPHCQQACHTMGSAHCHRRHRRHRQHSRHPLPGEAHLAHLAGFISIDPDCERALDCCEGDWDDGAAVDPALGGRRGSPAAPPRAARPHPRHRQRPARDRVLTWLSSSTLSHPGTYCLGPRTRHDASLHPPVYGKEAVHLGLEQTRGVRGLTAPAPRIRRIAARVTLSCLREARMSRAEYGAGAAFVPW